MSKMIHPLRGLRILDASRVLAGPFCGQLLADLGAEVIKVEDPKAGDETRGWGPPFAPDGLSAYFLSSNRNKRSVTLDLKTKSGLELFLALARKSDVVIENFRRSSASSLGISAKDLHAVNPRLVVCSISGYGDGPCFGPKAGYDFVVQGLSGMMATTGPADGAPHKVGVAMADIVTGLYAGIAALAGIHARSESGHGYAIDVALIDCAVASMANVVQAFLTSGKQPKRQGNAHLQIVPYQLFEASDGWLVLAVGNDGQWRNFCKVAGREDLARDESFAKNADRVRRRDEIVPVVVSIIKSRSVEAWQTALDAAGVPAGPVWNFEQLFASELAAERKLTITARRPDGTPVELVRSPLVSDELPVTAPPRLGEHTAQVLGDVLGLDAAHIERLRNEGAI